MATSLAAQLKKLAVPETQKLLREDYRQDSFLYDEGEAKTFDKQHFYNIGVNGLQQLCEKDDRFFEFERNLFSPASQTLLRYVQTSEANKELDKVIGRFLLMLSPYMQLREAHKALEWLVHRYNVHLRNTDVLMMCVLPFHDQAPFTLTLRLLKLDSKEGNKWKWLNPIKKEGSFLPRATLVTHCRSANGFMGFMNEMLTKHIEANTNENGIPSSHHLTRILSFYTQTTLGVLHAGPVSELMVSVLVPTISTGLKARDLPEHVLSSYMILSQLLVKVTMSQSLLTSLINVICKNLMQQFLRSAVSVMVLMFQKQEISKISKKACKYLRDHKSFVQTLALLTKEVDTESFVTALLVTTMSRALKQDQDTDNSTSNTDDLTHSPVDCTSFLFALLQNITLEQTTATVVTRRLLTYLHDKHLNNSEFVINTDGAAFRIFKILENRYSHHLESEVKQFCKGENAKMNSKIVKILYQTSVMAAKHDLVEDPVLSMAVCLHHPNHEVRGDAVKTLLKNINIMEDTESVQTALVLRLQDENHSVVEAVLSHPKNLWQTFIDKDVLYSALIKKFSMNDRKKNSLESLRYKVLLTLCHTPESTVNEMELLVLVLSYLAAGRGTSETVSLLKSPFAKKNKLLSEIAKAHSDREPVKKKMRLSASESTKSDNVEYKIIDIAASYLQSLDNNITLINELYSHVSKFPHPKISMATVLLIHLAVIQKSRNEKNKTALQKQLVIHFSQFFINQTFTTSTNVVYSKKTDFDDLLKTHLTELETNTAPWKVDLVCFLLKHLQLDFISSTLKDLVFWEKSKLTGRDSDWVDAMTRIVCFLFNTLSNTKLPSTSPFPSILNTYLKKLGDPLVVVKFLCLLWTSDVSAPAKAQSLQFGLGFLKSLDEQSKAKISTSLSPVIPCFLLLLTSRYEKVRQICIAMMELFSTDKLNSRFDWMVQNLINFKQEIIKDSTFLPQVLKTMFEESEKAVSPKKRRRSSSKETQRESTLKELLTIVRDADTPMNVKAGLTSLLSRLESVESFLMLAPLLKEMVTKFKQNDTNLPVSDHEAKIVTQLLLRYTTSINACLAQESEAFQTFLLALKCQTPVDKKGTTVQNLALSQLSKEFFAELPKECSKKSFVSLLDCLTSTSDVNTAKLCRKVVKRITLDSQLVLDELSLIFVNPNTATVREAKKIKKQISEDEDSVFDEPRWRRLTCLLEMIQNKKKITSVEKILPVAFKVLGKVLELGVSESGEYLKQLLLTTVYSICQRYLEKKDIEVTGQHLNMEVIVQCIRTSDNSSTHHLALLLLSDAAKIAPALLLHNMMSVFTFMGASILRQDDAYSFHVIGRILENVIPALVMACDETAKESKSASKSKKKRSEDMMSVVLRVFVDAIPHVPAHRKIVLFEKLITVVGADSYLWRLILLYVESVTVRAKPEPQESSDLVYQQEEEKKSGPLTTGDMEFLSSIVELFSCKQLFVSVVKSLQYVMTLPEEQEMASQVERKSVKKEAVSLECMTQEDMEIFSVSQHTSKQLRHFKYGAVYALCELMASQQLVAQLCEMESSEYLTDYQLVLETHLKFIAQVTDSFERHKTDKSVRFWRVLLNKCQEFLDNLVNLLPDSHFMDVVCKLMDHTLPLVQRRAMELLNSKLQHYKDGASHQHMDSLIQITNKLKNITKDCLLGGRKHTEWSEEKLVNGQTSLYSLKLLCRIFGEKQNDTFLQILSVCADVLARHQKNGIVSSSAMLCLAEIVTATGAHSLQFLKDFMPLLIHQLQEPEILGQDILLVSVLTSLQKIIESLALFVSPYLTDIVIQVCKISSRVQKNSESYKSNVLQKITAICTTLSTSTSTRYFLPTLEKCFSALKEDIASSWECAMNLLKNHIVNMSREDISNFSEDIFKFFFVCLDIRGTHAEIPESDLKTIENDTNQAFVTLVLKLSEAQFKPMLLKLYYWAVEEESDSQDRVITFYRLCNCLAGKLKKLFLLFAGHIIKHCAQTLDSNHKHKSENLNLGGDKLSKMKRRQLLCDVLDCLQKMFAYDSEGFINKSRFDVVMQPIVDQLENLVGKNKLTKSVQGHLFPCISSLVANVRDDSLWKDLNYQILLKTRHENPQVRLAALGAIDIFHKQLGEDYTALVPETIPFMAELMEDDVDEVEKQTQKVLAAMELSVGENLQEYF